MKKRKITHPVLLGRPLKESEKINGISHAFPDVRIRNFGGDDFVTSRALREKGIIVCSDCGAICSDSQEKCPSCRNKLIAILDDLPRTEIIEPEPIRKFIKSIINYK